MTGPARNLFLALAAVALVTTGLVGGVALDRLAHRTTASNTPAPERRVLYWYDPMAPAQHFDRPGRSPYMDMPLTPRYADEEGTAPGVAIDARTTQSLGMRLATSQRGTIGDSITATGVIDFNQRDVAIVQIRAGGFVQRVYGRAPGDIVRAGSPIADVLVPEWGGAQSEYLAIRRTGDPRLTAAARQRLLLLGMPESMVAAVERSGRPRNVITVTAPIGGVIRALGVRSGMTVSQGQTLAEITGLSTVWLNVAIPEAAAGRVRLGQGVIATLPAFPGQTFSGRLSAILPEAAEASHTVTGRVELSNRGGLLRPGMYASVQLGGSATPALLIPSEAVIRTGRRSLVMLAEVGGRFRPAEIQTGREADGLTEVLAGLSEGERIVASGQFLIDSEASLAGVQARPVGAPPTPGPAATLFEGVGRIEQIGPTSVTLSHDQIPGAGWPAMTMTFALANPAVGRGHRVGERVRFAFDRPSGALPTIRRMTTEGARR